MRAQVLCYFACTLPHRCCAPLHTYATLPHLFCCGDSDDQSNDDDDDIRAMDGDGDVLNDIDGVIIRR